MRVRRAISLIIATLREVFDEAAYMRFLEGRQIPSSRRAFAEFRREREAVTARSPKCC